MSGNYPGFGCNDRHFILASGYGSECESIVLTVISSLLGMVFFLLPVCGLHIISGSQSTLFCFDYLLGRVISASDSAAVLVTCVHLQVILYICIYVCTHKPHLYLVGPAA